MIDECETGCFPQGLENAHFRNYISASVLKIITNLPVTEHSAALRDGSCFIKSMSLTIVLTFYPEAFSE
jgi:hypothetical protein